MAVLVAAAAAAAYSVGVVTPVAADEVQQFNFTPRSFDGVGNNEANPDWGAAGTPQVLVYAFLGCTYRRVRWFRPSRF